MSLGPSLSPSAAIGAVGATGDSLFPYSRWNAALATLRAEYQRQPPFPHAHLSQFLEARVADRLIDEFVDPHHGPWVQYKHYNENHLGMFHRDAFPPVIRQVFDELNSPSFVAWLSELTGIPRLIADPSLEGGGLHLSEAGSFLHIHADFTRHHHHTNWRRRVNVIVYLNRSWQTEWGGAIELWDQAMQRPVVRIPPLFNHAIIFNTDERSYHGFPDPLTCPPGVMRRSLALYYYTADADVTANARSTNYRPRPGDGLRKSALIWADRQLVDVYSRVKSTLHLSDDFASRALGFLHQRKKTTRR
jgi:hypothetical protein